MKSKIAIIGLGYVGLPLAIGFSKFHEVIGFDINPNRVHQLNQGVDSTGEKDLRNIKKKIIFTDSEKKLKNIDIFIVTVPTPIDIYNNPDLSHLRNASKIVGRNIRKNGFVIFESTVFPGCTEEECVPIIEKISKFKLNRDFFCGYSPERINPGDKKNNLENIIKVVSGSNEFAAKKINQLYKKIIKAGTHLAPNIKVAEGAKVIENIQRDVNIALINELSILFRKMGIDFKSTLAAANTKWNFLDFKPGLVGGHCIGVDPYYLTHKSKEFNFHPEMILAGRRVNDYMGRYIGIEFLKHLNNKKFNLRNVKILVLGYTFKENCPDTRNTKVIDILNHLKENDLEYSIYDPYVDPKNIKNLKFIYMKDIKKYDAVILAVPHKKFLEKNFKMVKNLIKKKHFIFDVKGVLPDSFQKETL